MQQMRSPRAALVAARRLFATSPLATSFSFSTSQLSRHSVNTSMNMPHAASCRLHHVFRVALSNNARVSVPRMHCASTRADVEYRCREKRGNNSRFGRLFRIQEETRRRNRVVAPVATSAAAVSVSGYSTSGNTSFPITTATATSIPTTTATATYDAVRPGTGASVDDSAVAPSSAIPSSSFDAGSADTSVAFNISETMNHILDALSSGQLLSLPLEAVADSLRFIHVTTGLPWWATIGLFGMGVRVSMMPLQWIAADERARVSSDQGLQLSLARGVARGRKLARQYGEWSSVPFGVRLAERKRRRDELKKELARPDLKYSRAASYAPIWAGIPISMLMIMGVRTAVLGEFDAACLQNGGFAWFTDLTARDIWGRLPWLIASANIAVHFGTLKHKEPRQGNVRGPASSVEQTVAPPLPWISVYGVPLLWAGLVPLMSALPVGVHVYLMSSTLVSAATAIDRAVGWRSPAKPDGNLLVQQATDISGPSGEPQIDFKDQRDVALATRTVIHEAITDGQGRPLQLRLQSRQQGHSRQNTREED